MSLPDPGVPQELAAERSASLDDLRYELAFEIPEAVEEPVHGRLRAQFLLRDASRPLVLDFAPPVKQRAIETLISNGSPVEAQHVNGHIVISDADLREGPNVIEIAFRAGEAALHRSPDFLYTLLVPALARTVFPVFDQPDLKARYRLELELPPDWIAVSNSDEESRENLPGRARIRFRETRPLPSYLFAFAAGRFRVEEARRGGRRLRMFHRETDAPRVERNRDSAFDLHARALEWLEEYTGLPYPFGKFDFVLIPAFQFAGMEHPGAVYYRDSDILLEPAATEGQRLRRAGLIAHETAHIWFGDLVTMRWFDDVWLKEVFAGFMADKIAAPSFPDLDPDLLFLVRHYPAAYAIDRTGAAHPIREPLENLEDAGDLYDAIAYHKAPIVMRQLEQLLGEDDFRAGVRVYLEDFRFGNAAWPDLVQRLDARTPLDVEA